MNRADIKDIFIRVHIYNQCTPVEGDTSVNEKALFAQAKKLFKNQRKHGITKKNVIKLYNEGSILNEQYKIEKVTGLKRWNLRKKAILADKHELVYIDGKRQILMYKIYTG